jgi:hypothetical protein
MTFRKSTLLLIALATIAGLVGCSSSSKPPITVAFTGPTTVVVNSQTALTATVANDSANGGVTWSCSTASGSCGTFSSPTSASGVAVTYTAPSSIASSPVTITATSVTTPTIFAADTGVTVTAATLADGTYVYSLSGFDANDSLYEVSGAFTIAGGAVTGGEQDFVDNTVLGTTDQIDATGSGVTTNADGNLQITLVTCNGVDCTNTDTGLPSGGTEILAGTITPLNPNKALITEFDTSATSSGELDLQVAAAATATPAGGYAFGLNGLDFDEGEVSLGGIINVDGAGTISGAGSEYDVNDADDGILYQAQTISSGTVSSPDPFGRVTFTLNNPTYGSFVIAGYIVDSSRIRLVENYTDGFGGTTGGTALSQATADVGAFSATNVSGNSYVVGLNGFDPIFAYQVVGLFTLNADFSVTGFVNYNDTSGTGVQAPSPILADPAGGTWSIDAAGTVSLTGVTDGISTFNLQLYIDGNGNLLSISLDEGDVLGGRGWQQSGTGFTASSFSGAYALDATGWDIDNFDEFDAVGPVTADGTASITGFADYNWVFTEGAPFADSPVAGSFTAASSGVFTGTITGLDADNCSVFGVGAGCSNDAFSYYLIDATGDNIAIETDPNQVTLGYFLQQ